MSAFVANIPLAETEFQEQKVEVETVTESQVMPSSGTQPEPPVKRVPLSGYDATMRRHAAACETGR